MALALICGLLGAAFASFAFWFSWILALLGLVFLVVWLREQFGADPYRLSALHEHEEREELWRLLEEEPTIADEAEVVCPNCMEAHLARLRVCPRCGKGH